MRQHLKVAHSANFMSMWEKTADAFDVSLHFNSCERFCIVVDFVNKVRAANVIQEREFILKLRLKWIF